jgi:hypothetical protein
MEPNLVIFKVLPVGTYTLAPSFLSLLEALLVNLPLGCLQGLLLCCAEFLLWTQGDDP